MAHGIGLAYSEDEKWIFIHGKTSEKKVVTFGQLDEGSQITTNSNNNLLSYSTEDELEIAVDAFVNQPNYYKEQAEAFESTVYLGISDKYPVIEPSIEED
tara:strand:- start:169 stop:468 length:300 start_codon:yes stop_codon:yes gene_type:complete